MQKQTNTIAGFTLIEMAVVTAVAVILSFTGYMVIGNVMQNTSIDAASRRVLSDLQLARERAQTTGVLHGISFVANGSYTVYQTSVATPIADPLLGQSMVVNLDDDYPGAFIVNNYTVEFDSWGAPYTGGGGQVQVSDNSTIRTITTDSNTGRIHMN